MLKPALPLMLTALCCACAASPHAMIDGTRASRTDFNEAEVRVVAIDNRLVRARGILTVSPGFHEIYVVSTRSSSRGGYAAQPFALMAEPCMRYVIAARHGTSVDGENWELALKSVEPIPWCSVPQEAQKEVQSSQAAPQ